MSDSEKVKNIITFLFILFGEKSHFFIEEIMDFSPDYIIEKFERYVMSMRPESDWGIHPNLRRQLFNPYCKKWGLELTADE